MSGEDRDAPKPPPASPAPGAPTGMTGATPPLRSLSTSFLSGVAAGPASWLRSRYALASLSLPPAPLTRSLSAIAWNAGASNTAALGDAMYRAQPTEEQRRLQGAAAQSAGQLGGAVATGMALSRLMARVPGPAGRAARLTTLAMTAGALANAPGMAEAHVAAQAPAAYGAARRTTADVAALSPGLQTAGVQAATAALRRTHAAPPSESATPAPQAAPQPRMGPAATPIPTTGSGPGAQRASSVAASSASDDLHHR